MFHKYRRLDLTVHVMLICILGQKLLTSIRFELKSYQNCSIRTQFVNIWIDPTQPNLSKIVYCIHSSNLPNYFNLLLINKNI